MSKGVCSSWIIPYAFSLEGDPPHFFGTLLVKRGTSSPHYSFCLWEKCYEQDKNR